MNKYERQPGGQMIFTGEPTEKDLMLKLAAFSDMIEGAYKELAPHKICAYIYELANAFNSFYHEVHILTSPDPGQKDSYVTLLMLTKNVLECCIDLLGFSAPDRM